MTEPEMLIIANEVASRHGLVAEYLTAYNGKPARKVCVVGDDRKYNPICVLKGPFPGYETLADISLEISNRADITCTYDITPNTQQQND
jgi:hypothetical protein